MTEDAGGAGGKDRGGGGGGGEKGEHTREKEGKKNAVLGKCFTEMEESNIHKYTHPHTQADIRTWILHTHTCIHTR